MRGIRTRETTAPVYNDPDCQWESTNLNKDHENIDSLHYKRNFSLIASVASHTQHRSTSRALDLEFTNSMPKIWSIVEVLYEGCFFPLSLRSRPRLLGALSDRIENTLFADGVVLKHNLMGDGPRSSNTEIDPIVISVYCKQCRLAPLRCNEAIDN